MSIDEQGNMQDLRRRNLLDMNQRAQEGGGADKVKKQHGQGKYTARERIERLVDPASFVEFDKFVVHRCSQFGIENEKYFGDGVITGIAKINGQEIGIFAQDFTCWGGALGMAHAKKICKVMDFALEHKIPMIGINDSGGARIQEGVESLAGYAEIFHRNVRCSGIIPQISLIMGPCAGGAVYSPGITDFIFMVDKTSYMFVTGPEVIKTVTHEDVTKEALGGASSHNERSGVGHFKAQDEDECFERVRELLSFLPASNENSARGILHIGTTSDPMDRKNPKLINLIPDNPKKPYDMKEVIWDIVDQSQFLEVHKDFARNIICGFASFGGIKVGVVANQPSVLAGCLDIDSSVKGARFIRFCDAFHIPIVTLVDVPGFLPGTVQEYGGIIRHGSKLLYAYSEATVPLVTLITRKAYGGAYDVMASKHIGADINLAFPSAEIAVMGSEGAVNIIFKNELKRLSADESARRKTELMLQYEKEFNNPYKAAELGYIDQIILPEDTRSTICSSLRLLRNKKSGRPFRKHGNIPL